MSARICVIDARLHRDPKGAEGRYLGAVRVAARVRDFALGAGMLAAVTLDELDVPRIAVWRVQ